MMALNSRSLLCLLVIHSHAMLCTTADLDAYVQCDLDLELGALDITHAETTPHPQNDVNITLYYSGTGITWCEAYKVCRNMSSRLLVIPDEDVQNTIKEFNVTLTYERAWIAGARKNHGNNWTWVNESLFDCLEDPCEDLYNSEGEYGRFRLNADGYELAPSPISGSFILGLCSTRTPTLAGLNWYEQQNYCLSTDGRRLATLDEALQFNEQGVPVYVGLQFRPWLWIGEEVLVPVVFTSWSQGGRQPAGSADCLSVELNVSSLGQWIEQNCTEALQYFMCEGEQTVSTTEVPSTVGETTTGLQSTEVLESEATGYQETGSGVPATAETTEGPKASGDEGVPLEYWLPAVLVGVVLLIVIPVTVVMVKRKKRRASQDLKQQIQTPYFNDYKDSPGGAATMSGPFTLSESSDNISALPQVHVPEHVVPEATAEQGAAKPIYVVH